MMKPQSHCKIISITHPHFNQEYLYYYQNAHPVTKNFHHPIPNHPPIQTQQHPTPPQTPLSKHLKPKNGLLLQDFVPRDREGKDKCKDNNLGKRSQNKSRKKQQKDELDCKNKKRILQAKQGQIKSQYYDSRKQGRPQQAKRQQTIQSNQLSKILEVTFSMDSTEPETDQKQITNQYQLPNKPQNITPTQYTHSPNPFLNTFRKKLIQKQIEEKERVYRHYIRSQSRSKDKEEKWRIKSRMKEVLNSMYELKKLIRE